MGKPRHFVHRHEQEGLKRQKPETQFQQLNIIFQKTLEQVWGNGVSG